jgi:hypothetical protein
MKKLLWGCLLLLGACVGHDDSSELAPGSLAVVKHGTSFGMCVGLCQSELTILPTRMELTRQPWGRGNGNGATPKTCQQVVPSPDWVALLGQFDAAAFSRLPEVIGCPDCADGGAEWLELTYQGQTRKVTFEHGRPVPEIAPFLTQVRQLRERMNNCE